MLTRCLSLFVASLAATAVAAGPAQSRTDIPAPNVPAGACTDQSPPTSTYTSKAAKRAKRTKVLKGTARDIGCGLDGVEVSVARRVGKKCKYQVNSSRLSGRSFSCGHVARWLPAQGTTSWSFRLPKKLAHGKYLIRTRATDFAGNVEKAKSHSLNVR